MPNSDYQSLLAHLLNHWESETVEFKEADNNYDTDKIGRYFAALANEANLEGSDSAWLVFGVNDKTRSVVGTNYRPEIERLQSIKQQVSQETAPRISFRSVEEYQSPVGRVVFFEIPPAPQGMPISWKGHFYGRDGESLGPLSLDKLDMIRTQATGTDWSAQVVEDAVIDDLDLSAVKRARQAFSGRHSNRFDEEQLSEWSDHEFLDRAKITIDGKMTTTAILLLGKPESSHFLNPHPAQITWKLEDGDKAYEHFGPPFFLNTTQIYKKIRNFQIKIFPEEELFSVEISKYDQRVILEALHNCIAHQDYSRNGRIIVTEFSDRLAFENEGRFLEGKPEDFFLGEKTPRRYRNPFLAQAMVELGMIDTMGYGIHTMYQEQADRYLPLPDFDLDEEGNVRLIIHGSVVDPAYSRMLMQQAELSLADAFALDRVQKKLPLDAEVVKQLKKRKLIEGRRPNLHISAKVARAADAKAEYFRTRSLDDGYAKKLILDYLSEFGSASRKEIDDFLMDKLGEILSEAQKSNKVSNLLTNLRRSGEIENRGSRKSPEWHIAE